MNPLLIAIPFLALLAILIPCQMWVVTKRAIDAEKKHTSTTRQDHTMDPIFLFVEELDITSVDSSDLRMVPMSRSEYVLECQRMEVPPLSEDDVTRLASLTLIGIGLVPGVPNDIVSRHLAQCRALGQAEESA